MTRPLLRAEDVAYRYRQAEQPSLNGVTLDIQAGEIFGLLGPNGAGKTTLISLIAGLLSSQQGRITFDGQPLEQARHEHPTAIALVPQDIALYPMLTVLENLRFFAGVQGIPKALGSERIEQAVAFCQLQAHAKKRASQLSGGLKRRLNLAIGLLGSPRLLLLDEPTVGVDPQSRHFLLDSIAHLRDTGTTVIYTSHYMDEVQTLCQHVAIIDQGRVLKQGLVSELTQNGTQNLEQVFMALTKRSLRD